MSGEKNSQRDCARLARYIAASARWRRRSASSAWVGAQAMPTVASTLSDAPATSKWRLSAIEDLLGGALGVAGARDVGEQDPEAVALHARDEVGGSHRALEPGGHLLEDGVALGAAERVVHVAEAVEVDDEERGLLRVVVVGRAEGAA